MKSLLNALQEGRLIELPEADKAKALEYLAHLIEAVPDLGGTPELAEAIMARERSQNTGIGLGVACPHVRVSGSGELLCAVGWSPEGIEYGAPDGRRVHLVVMYYIPDAQKNTYFKEISALAGAVRKAEGITALADAKDIAEVRERLLDWVSAAIDAALPETKARMIRLEAKQAQVTAGVLAPPTVNEMAPVLVLAVPGARPVALCENTDLAAELERDPGRISDWLEKGAPFDLGGFRLVFRSRTPYSQGRILYEYLALR